MTQRSESPLILLCESEETGRQLAVRFDHDQDRYRHVVIAIDSEGRHTTLLESIEGGSDQRWPSSPPLQHEGAATGADDFPVLLFTGSAGDSHWSWSVERESASLHFDIACRARRAPPVLTTSYSMPQGACHKKSAWQVDCRTSGIDWRLELLAVDRANAEPSIHAEPSEERLVIEVKPNAESQPPNTLRWRYAVQLLS